MTSQSTTRVVTRNQYASTYKQIPVQAFMVTTTEKGIELRAFTEEHDFTPSEPPQANSIYIQRTVETCLVINPMQAKSLNHFLEGKIREFEEIYGTIPSYEDVSKKRQEKAIAQNTTNVVIPKKSDFGIG